MYLSDRDLRLVLQVGLLIVNPPPTEIDTNSIDLHIDVFEEAKIWDVAAYETQQGSRPWPPGSPSWPQFAPGRLPAPAGPK